jgi:hypothetical protein
MNTAVVRRKVQTTNEEPYKMTNPSLKTYYIMTIKIQFILIAN